MIYTPRNGADQRGRNVWTLRGATASARARVDAEARFAYVVLGLRAVWHDGTDRGEQTLGAVLRFPRARYHVAAWLIAVLALVWLGHPSMAGATTTLNPPTNVQVAGSSPTSLTISWMPSSSPGVTGYDTFILGGYPGSPSWVEYGKVYGATTSAQTFTGLTCGLQYQLSVEAFDSAGDTSAPVVAVGVPSRDGFGHCNADVGIVSVTPSVTHAQVGQDVTFTIVSGNNGPDPSPLWVTTTNASTGLTYQSVTCDVISNDGSACEHNFTQPGTSYTDRIVAQVQASSSGYATDVACASTPLDQLNYIDVNFSNNCGIGTVAIDPGAAAPPPPPPPDPAVAPVSPAPAVSAPASPAAPVFTPILPTVTRSTSPRSCPAYTVVHALRSGHRTRRHSTRIAQIFPGTLSCSVTRNLIDRADAAFARTRPGVYVRVTRWVCRELRDDAHVVSIDSCRRSDGARSSWTETRLRRRQKA